MAVLKALTDQEITVLINKFYRVDAGSEYLTILPKLSMAKTTTINRDDIDTYAANILEPYEIIQHSKILVMVEQMQKLSIKVFSLEFSLLRL